VFVRGKDDLDDLIPLRGLSEAFFLNEFIQSGANTVVHERDCKDFRLIVESPILRIAG